MKHVGLYSFGIAYMIATVAFLVFTPLGLFSLWAGVLVASMGWIPISLGFYAYQDVRYYVENKTGDRL